MGFGGSGGGGNSSIAGAADVALNTLDNNDVLAYDETSEKWLNKTVLDDKVIGYNGASGLWIGTQVEYDAIDPKNATTLYVVREP